MIQKKIKKNNILAEYSLFVAIISLFINIWSIAGITATVLAIIALLKIRKSSDTGKILAIIGVIIGIAATMCQIYSLLKLFKVI